MKPILLFALALGLTNFVSETHARTTTKNSVYKKIKNSSAVDRTEREDAIAKSGLSDATNGWDELDLDMLFLKAQSQPVEKFITQHSELDKNALKKFHEIANEE